MQGTQANKNAKGPFRFFFVAFEVGVGFAVEVEGADRGEVAAAGVVVEGFEAVTVGTAFESVVSLDPAVVETVVLVFSSSLGSLDATTG